MPGASSPSGEKRCLPARCCAVVLRATDGILSYGGFVRARRLALLSTVTSPWFARRHGHAATGSIIPNLATQSPSNAFRLQTPNCNTSGIGCCISWSAAAPLSIVATLRFRCRRPTLCSRWYPVPLRNGSMCKIERQPNLSLKPGRLGGGGARRPRGAP